MQKEKKKILSISLLASNRKETIRKCLDSLVPIMEQIESELIIVDTGCDEETRTILLEYTDQIISFEWCNDFSKARNIGLKKAVGEWFLYIDDDEWFTDVAEIVEFFKSGEYKKYGLACYIQRNYSDYEEQAYKDSWVSRMIRLDKDTRFVSSIHEYLFPIRGECKLLYAPVKHFGYIFKSDEEKYRHSERNVSLLLDMIKKERGNLRWWVQLANEYAGIKEYRKLYELCQEGISLVSKYNEESINKERGAFYCGRINAAISTFRFDTALKDYEEAIADKRNTNMCKARLYAYGAEAYFRKTDYEKACECCEKYIQIYEQLYEDDLKKMQQGAFFVSDALEKRVRNIVYSMYISCELKLGKKDALKTYFDELGWEDSVLYIFNSILPDIIDTMANTEFDEDYVKIAETIVNRKGPQERVINLLQEKEKKSEEEFLKLLPIFAAIECPHYYIWYIKLRNADIEKNKTRLSEAFEKLFGCVADIFQLEDLVWEIAERNQLDLEPLFFQIPFEQWKTGVDFFCEHTSLEKIKDRCELVTKTKKIENVRYQYFFLKTTEAMIVYGYGRESYLEMNSLLRDFVVKCISFYRMFFKKMAFTGEMEFLPKNCKAAVYLKKALDSEEKEEFSLTGGYLKDCIGIFPSFDTAIKCYVKLYGEECKRKAGYSDEFENLVIQIKEKINGLIEMEKIEEAKSVLSQLQTIIPEDEEVAEIQKKLNSL